MATTSPEGGAAATSATSPVQLLPTATAIILEAPKTALQAPAKSRDVTPQRRPAVPRLSGRANSRAPLLARAVNRVTAANKLATTSANFAAGADERSPSTSSSSTSASSASSPSDSAANSPARAAVTVSSFSPIRGRAGRALSAPRVRGASLNAPAAANPSANPSPTSAAAVEQKEKASNGAESREASTDSKPGYNTDLNPAKYATSAYWDDRFRWMLRSESKGAPNSMLPTSGGNGTGTNAAASPSALSKIPSTSLNSASVPAAFIRSEEFYNIKYAHAQLGMKKYLHDDFSKKILHIGCGLSIFGIHLSATGGYTNLLNTDVSPVCIQAMRKAYPGHNWAVMDCMDMVTKEKMSVDELFRSKKGEGGLKTAGAVAGVTTSTSVAGKSTVFPTSSAAEGGTASPAPSPPPTEKCLKLPLKSIQAVVDKGVLDSLLCGKGGIERFKTCLDQCHAVLEDGGLFFALAGSTLTMWNLEQFTGKKWKYLEKFTLKENTKYRMVVLRKKAGSGMTEADL